MKMSRTKEVNLLEKIVTIKKLIMKMMISKTP